MSDLKKTYCDSRKGRWGEIVFCTLPHGHPGQHEARDARGRVLRTWPQDDREPLPDSKVDKMDP